MAIKLPGPNLHSLPRQLIDEILVNTADDRTGHLFQQGGLQIGRLYEHWNLGSFLSVAHNYGSAIVVRLSWILFRDNSHGYAYKYDFNNVLYNMD